MAESFIIVNQSANNVVITNSDPASESVITQNLVVSSDPIIQIVSPNTNPGISTLATSEPPAANNSPGYAGEIRFDNNFIYLCIVNNTWKKVSLQDI